MNNKLYKYMMNKIFSVHKLKKILSKHKPIKDIDRITIKIDTPIIVKLFIALPVILGFMHIYILSDFFSVPLMSNFSFLDLLMIISKQMLDKLIVISTFILFIMGYIEKILIKCGYKILFLSTSAFTILLMLLFDNDYNLYSQYLCFALLLLYYLSLFTFLTTNIDILIL